MPQLLHLQNGESVRAEDPLRRGPAGRAGSSDDKDDAKVTDELFLATLSRLPTRRRARSRAAASLEPGTAARRCSATCSGRC